MRGNSFLKSLKWQNNSKTHRTKYGSRSPGASLFKQVG